MPGNSSPLAIPFLWNENVAATDVGGESRQREERFRETHCRRSSSFFEGYTFPPPTLTVSPSKGRRDNGRLATTVRSPSSRGILRNKNVAATEGSRNDGRLANAVRPPSSRGKMIRGRERVKGWGNKNIKQNRELF